MANYEAFSRTNYFGVKDADSFKNAVAHLPLVRLVPYPAPCDGARFALVSDEGGMPDVADDPDNPDEEVDFDIGSFLAEHLADDEVAVVMEVGYESTRYLAGHALAINNRGERREISLSDIYSLAKELNNGATPISPAEY